MNDEMRVYQDSVMKILVLDYFPAEEGWLIERYKAVGNNNTQLGGIMIRRSKIEHLVSLEDIRKYYEAGYNAEATAQEICGDYINKFIERKMFQSLDRECFKNFEDMKDKICYRVINAKLNQNIDAPYIPISDDLMMTFFIHYQFNKDIFEVINIDNNFIKMWNLENVESTLYCLAEENTKRIYPVRMMPLLDYFKECFPIEIYESLKRQGIKEGEDPIYLLTNLYRVNGAGVVAYGKGETLYECMKQIEAEIGTATKGMYILPMSIKEVFIIPDTGRYTISDVREMIKTSKDGENDFENFLSDNVFYYDDEKGFTQLTFINREICR